jgi:hypothetical protein
VIDPTAAALVADIEKAVSEVPKDQDPDIYQLVRGLKIALEIKDERAFRRKAGEIAEHATHRYLAVVEYADRLVRHLDETRRP